MTKKAEKAKNTDKTTDDSSNSGAAQPSITSRPILVENKSSDQDDPIVASKSDAEPTAKIHSSGKVVIKPLADSDVNQDAEVKNETDDSKETKKNDQTDAEGPLTADVSELENYEEDNKETEDETKDQNSKDKSNDKTESEESIDNEDIGLVDELAKQAADKKQQDEANKEMDAKRDKINELAAVGTYNLPISHITHRGFRTFITVLIILVILAAVGLNFALDANLLDIGINPLTDIL